MEGLLHLHSSSLENKRDPSNSFLMQTDGGLPKSAAQTEDKPQQPLQGEAARGLTCLRRPCPCGLDAQVMPF